VKAHVDAFRSLLLNCVVPQSDGELIVAWQRGERLRMTHGCGNGPYPDPLLSCDAAMNAAPYSASPADATTTSMMALIAWIIPFSTVGSFALPK
jgi:hypothetical protein